MDDLTDEHRMLLDSLDSMLAALADPAALWPTLARNGMLGLMLDADAGGAGLGMAEVLVLVRRLGRSAIPSNLIPAEAVAMPMLNALRAHPAVATALPRLLDGSALACTALGDRDRVVARLTDTGDLCLSGTVPAVAGGAEAGLVVVGAMLDGAPVLVLYDASGDGPDRTCHLPREPGSGADLRFGDTSVPAANLLARGDEAARLIANARDNGQLATCAQMLGAMEGLLDLTLDYLRTRRQFGQPLAGFQVLQHAAVDMYVELETARAMLTWTGHMFDPAGSAPSPERRRALDATKLKLNTAARFLAESAVQLHGGIGMTRESLTGQLFARLTTAQLSHGDSRACLNRLVADGHSIALS